MLANLQTLQFILSKILMCLTIHSLHWTTRRWRGATAKGNSREEAKGQHGSHLEGRPADVEVINLKFSRLGFIHAKVVPCTCVSWSYHFIPRYIFISWCKSINSLQLRQMLSEMQWLSFRCYGSLAPFLDQSLGKYGAKGFSMAQLSNICKSLTSLDPWR